MFNKLYLSFKLLGFIHEIIKEKIKDDKRKEINADPVGYFNKRYGDGLRNERQRNHDAKD